MDSRHEIIINIIRLLNRVLNCAVQFFKSYWSEINVDCSRKGRFGIKSNLFLKKGRVVSMAEVIF